MTPRAVEPLVQVEEVTYPPLHEDQLVDRHIESGAASDIYALKVRGWAIGSRQPVTHFELAHRGMVLEKVAALPSPELAALRPDDQYAGQSRVELPVSSLDLPYRFHLVVRAVLADQTRARVAALTGTRAALPGGPATGPGPILLSTIGRSGSTAVSNLLCHHPDLAGYRTWDAETRMVSYWTSVLRALARPAGYERQLEAAGHLEGNWWLGEAPPDPEFADDPALAVLGVDAVEAAASFCRSQMGLIGSWLVAASGKPGARYLVEKAAPHWVRSVAEMSEELDPRTREIVLVRDFRDVACSMFAYTQRRGFTGFGPRPGASMDETIRWLSAGGASSLVDYIGRRGAQAHVFRYEDLITRPAAALAEMLEYVGVDARSQTVAAMLERLGAESARRDNHATTASPEKSLGRWRHELDADQQALAQHLLRPQLDALGYE